MTRGETVTFDIDGESSDHPGAVAFSEMFGSLGTLSLRKDDPLLDRLKRGAELTVAIKGASIDIPLTGSKAAIEELVIGCE